MTLLAAAALPPCPTAAAPAPHGCRLRRWRSCGAGGRGCGVVRCGACVCGGERELDTGPAVSVAAHLEPQFSMGHRISVEQLSHRAALTGCPILPFVQKKSPPTWAGRCYHTSPPPQAGGLSGSGVPAPQTRPAKLVGQGVEGRVEAGGRVRAGVDWWNQCWRLCMEPINIPKLGLKPTTPSLTAPLLCRTLDRKAALAPALQGPCDRQARSTLSTLGALPRHSRSAIVSKHSAKPCASCGKRLVGM